MEKTIDVRQAIMDLANEELLPVANKLRGISSLLFCECKRGKEFEGDELNGISSILKELASELCLLYDKLNDAIK